MNAALIALAAIIGGAIPPISKIVLEQIPPLTFTFLRFLLAAVILLPLFYLRGSRLKRVASWPLLLVSLLATFNIILFIFGLRRTTATISQMLYAGVPLIAAVLSRFLLKEKFAVQKIAGLFIGFSGVCIIILLPVIGHSSAFNGDLIGNLLVAGGVCSFSLYSVLSKQLQNKCSPFDLTIFFILTTLFAGLILLPIDLRSHPIRWEQTTTTTILGLVYVGMLGTAFYYLIYQYAIKRASPVVASMILYLQPVCTIVWSSIILGERTTLGFVMGGLLSLLGVALVTNFGRVEKHTYPPHTQEP